jgi:hypothetical protein
MMAIGLHTILPPCSIGCFFMSNFFKKHKYSTTLFALIVITAAVSGYFGYIQSFFVAQDFSSEARSEAPSNDRIKTKVLSYTDEKIANKPKNLENVYTSVDISTKNSEVVTPNLKTNNQEIRKLSTQQSKKTDTQVQISVDNTLIVYDSIYKTAYSEDSSVYDMMKKARHETNFDFTGRDYGGNLGYFVDSISGQEHSAKDEKYWIYYINGQKAKVGISNYIIQPNDIIEWKYENSKI